jgi:hypothetical protein
MRHRWLIALCTAALLGACAKPEGGDAAKMEMRVYNVPAEQTEALSNAIGNVLGTAYDKTSFGKVSSPAPGQLVVLAPASLQGSIESTLRDLTKAAATESKTSPKNESPLRLSFWSVDAVPGNGADDATLASLAPALDEARKQMGAVHFVLHDQVNGVSSAGSQVRRSWVGGKTDGGSAQVTNLEYSLDKNSAGLSLDFRIGDQIPIRNGSSVSYISIGSNAKATIRIGQTIVLTQTPLARETTPRRKPPRACTSCASTK